MAYRAFPRVTLGTERLVLRPFEAGDAADVHAVWSDEVYLRFAPAHLPHAGADLDQAVEWCTRTAEDQRQAGKAVAFAGAERDGGRLACHVALFGTDWAAMITEIHYWTAPWARGRGYAAEAARAVARWALAEQGFARITLRTVTGNTASQKVAAAAGFRFEGVLRNAAWSRAGRGDMAVYSLIPRDLAEDRDP
jgi:RimJ/RimL family protein N-acetyltransferase